MNETDFEFWRGGTYPTGRGQFLDPKSRSSTMSSYRRVEKHFGDLDELLAMDACQSLLERLLGSKTHVMEDDPERVKASLRSAVVLFVKFRRNAILGRKASLRGLVDRLPANAFAERRIWALSRGVAQ